MNGIAIRLAQAADAGALHSLLGGLAAHVGDEAAFAGTPEDLVRYGFGARPAFEALLAERGARAVGMALFFPSFSTWRGRPGVYVQDLYVAPDARGEGLGRRLLCAVAARAAGWDATYMRLSVHAANAGGADFYRRLGFSARAEETINLAEGAAFEALARSGAAD